MKKSYLFPALLCTCGVAAMLPSLFGLILPTTAAVAFSETSLLCMLIGAVVAAIGLICMRRAALASTLFSVCAAVIFQMVNGIFGVKEYNYYNPYWVIALLGVVFIVAILMKFEMHGLASLIATLVPALVFCGFFIGFDMRPAYWHFADIPIDEPHLDHNYVAFCALLVVAFLVGEIAIYSKKPESSVRA